MVNNSLKNRAKELVARAKAQGLTKTYNEFCKSVSSKNSALSSEDVNYYTSRRKGDAN